MKWKIIPGHECYSVSEHGHVKMIKEPKGRKKQGVRVKPGTILKPYGSVYPSVTIWSDGKSIRQPVHILVAKAFLPPPKENEYLVRHLDDNVHNPHYSNLCWGDDRLNALDSIKNGNTRCHGFDAVQVRALRQEYATRKASGEKTVKVKMSREHRLNYWNLRDLLNGKRYAWVV